MKRTQHKLADACSSEAHPRPCLGTLIRREPGSVLPGALWVSPAFSESWENNFSLGIKEALNLKEMAETAPNPCYCDDDRHSKTWVNDSSLTNISPE